MVSKIKNYMYTVDIILTDNDNKLLMICSKSDRIFIENIFRKELKDINSNVFGPVYSANDARLRICLSSLNLEELEADIKKVLSVKIPKVQQSPFIGFDVLSKTEIDRFKQLKDWSNQAINNSIINSGIKSSEFSKGMIQFNQINWLQSKYF